jgi:hypothetical protein
MEEPRKHTRTRLPIPTQRDIQPVELAGISATLRGRRAILVNTHGNHYGWVVWRDEFGSSPGGYPTVQVVPESQWWRFVHTRQPPEITEWPAAAVWVEEA